VLALREIEARLGIAERLAAYVTDPRAPERVIHSVADILRFRMLMIAAGYEDANDADSLRHDPAFKLALGRLPDGTALCSQPTVLRLENQPRPRDLLRMGQAMVALYRASFRQAPRCITLDIDDTFDAVHGGQQLRLFNAHYDEYGLQPIVVFDGEGRPVAALLRQARRSTGQEVRGFLRHLIRAIRGHWPRVEILLCADSHYCAPEVLNCCHTERVDFILGVATTSTLRRHVEALEGSTAARQAAGTDKLQRYKEFHESAASWSRVERIIARVEAGPQGTDSRFVVTNLAGGSPRTMYEDLYCRRGQAENGTSEILWDGPPLSPAAAHWQGNQRDRSWFDANRGSGNRPGQEQLQRGGSGRRLTGGPATAAAARGCRQAGGGPAGLRDGNGGLLRRAPPRSQAARQGHQVRLMSPDTCALT